MAAVTTGRAQLGAAPAGAGRAGLAGTLRSELIKIRSVRSTYWALIMLVLASLAWSVALCAGEAAHWAQTPAPERAAFDPGQGSILGLASLGQLIIVVLGAL